MIQKIRYSAGDREGWLALRDSYADSRLGGSEIGAAANNSQYSSFFKLLCQKVGLEEIPDISGKMAVKLGIFNEPFVAQEFERVSGKKVHCENCIFLNSDYPHLLATIDRKISNEDSGLECKFMSDMAMRKFKHGDFPVAYKDQCTSYLAVTGLARWYLAIVTNYTLHVFLMTRDKAEEERFTLLRSKFGFAADETDGDYGEWRDKWSYLEGVYYVDDEEVAAAEAIAARFFSCLNQVKEFMKGREFRTEDERRAFLTNAVFQVVEPTDLGGDDATADAIGNVLSKVQVPDVEVEIPVVSEDGKALGALLESRDGVQKRLKELQEKVDEEKYLLGEYENAIEARIAGRWQTSLVGDWKIVLKQTTPRRTCPIENVERYFSSKGESIPEGIVNLSQTKIAMKISSRLKKACKPRKIKAA